MFSVLPDELNVDILERTSGQDLLNLCQSNKYFQRLCDDESFWEHKVKHDYYIHVPPYDTWKQLYIGLTYDQIRPIDIKHNGIILGYVIADKNDRISDLVMAGMTRINPSIQQYLIVEFLSFNGDILVETTNIDPSDDPITNMWNELGGINFRNLQFESDLLSEYS